MGCRARRALVVAVAAAAVAGAGACGSDDDGGATAAGEQRATSADEREVRALIDTMGTALADGDTRTVCDSMSRASYEALKEPEGGRPQSCEEIFNELFASGGPDEDLEPEVLAVKVDGAQAIATGRSKGVRGIQRAAFVKEDGEWKMRGWFTD